MLYESSAISGPYEFGLRNLETQTTLAFGFTSDSLSAEMERLEEMNLCLRPLADHLWDSAEVELSEDDLANEVMVWIEKKEQIRIFPLSRWIQCLAHWHDTPGISSMMVIA